MIERLGLIHRPREKFKTNWQGGFQLHTCMRSIFIDDYACLPEADGDEKLYGAEAAQFLIEVVCGLHSPVLGETEVFGQFRRAIQETQQLPFIEFFHKVVEVTKSVRHNHLRDLGASSYGSFCRKHLKSCQKKRVNIIGAGLLAEEIVHWLVKDFEHIDLFCRNPEKHSVSSYKNVFVHSVSNFEELVFQHNGALIIAAPIKSNCLRSSADIFSTIIDLRAESKEDPLSQHCVSLKYVFGQLAQQQRVADEKRASAISVIGRELVEIESTVSHRPFGWEDLCVS